MRALIFAICLLTHGYTWAAIGSVTEAAGVPGEITRGKDKLSGAKGAGIESNDIYATKNSSIGITFKDDTKVKVTENSRLVIDDFVFDPNKSDAGKLAMKVGMGTVRYASGQIAKTNPQQVAIKTPTATIAVRGTDFTMTVDEAGQSLVILLPSCRDTEHVKEYELEENLCRVGSIVVETQAGKVVLDRAFHATYVISNTMLPTAPILVNLVESKISNNLIIVKPSEITHAVRDQARTPKDKELEEIEAEAARRLAQKIKESAEAIEASRVLAMVDYSNRSGCNPTSGICVIWDKNEMDIQSRGKGVAYRILENEHYAEVKTQGYSSNTSVTIVHNDSYANEVIGSGDPGGNNVYIKQNSGVLKRK